MRPFCFPCKSNPIIQIICFSVKAVKLWEQAKLHPEGGGSQHPPGPDLPAPRPLQGRHHRSRQRGGRGRAPAVRLAVVLHRASGRRRDRDSGEDGVGARSWRCQQHSEVRRRRTNTFTLNSFLFSPLTNSQFLFVIISGSIFLRLIYVSFPKLQKFFGFI